MIFTFSCTGNTQWSAQIIAHTTGEKIVDIAHEMREKKEQLIYSLEQDERIGFCYPVHGWRPPGLVLDFINRFVIENATGHYCWALCTAGDDIGQSMEILDRHLQKKGMTTNSKFSLIMPESYVGLPFMDVDKPEKERRKREKAATYIRLYANTIARKEADITLTYKGHWPKTNSIFLGSIFKNLLISDKSFRVDSEKCIRCGRCAKVCPVDNISWQPGESPSWLHNGQCLTCFACYHHCPVKAIDYGRRTKKKGQYYYGKNISTHTKQE